MPTQRGRKPAAALAVRPIGNGTKPQIEAPEGLSADESAVFVTLMSAAPPGHFQASDEPLVAEYATAVAQARRAREHLHIEGDVVGGKPNAWLVVQEKAQRAIVSLSMRLRLSPQARREKAKEERPLDWAERFRLENFGHL
jgi:phage terminase small subunit